MAVDLQAVVDAFARSSPGVSWSICITDGDNILASAHPDRVLSTASIGKLMLLLEVARRLDNGVLRPDASLARTDDLAVADSGLWQHLRVESLPVEDLAVLVAAVSDNLATNVLLDHVGLSTVHAAGAAVGLEQTKLLDRVRNHRGDADPPHFSEGSAHELAAFMDRLGKGSLISPGVSSRLQRWLSVNVDLSMVAAPLGLDPLAHVDEDRRLTLINKTGTDTGVRADVGHLTGPRSQFSYAVIANWDEQTDQRDRVLNAMRTIGQALRDHTE